MIRRDIDKAVRLVISQELPVSLTRIIDDAELRADLAADGAGLIRLGQGLDRAFGIKLGADEIAFPGRTVGTLTDLVETKLENRRPG